MLQLDRSALICDLAETYGIYDYGSLPAETVAILASGLRDNSRIKMKASGAKASVEVLLLARIADLLAIQAWQQTKDGHKGRNRPGSILAAIMNGEDPNRKVRKGVVFRSPEEFWQARQRIIEGG